MYSQETAVDTLHLYNIELQTVLALIEEDEKSFEMIKDYLKEQHSKYSKLSFIMIHSLENLRSALPSK
jgi:hypothetical protein